MSAAKHKVMSTIRLPSHECVCPCHVEHVFDLNDQNPGSSKLRAAAEQQVVETVVAALGGALDASRGPLRPTDPICASLCEAAGFPAFPTGAVGSGQNSSQGVKSSYTCSACGLLQVSSPCRVCDLHTEAACSSRAYPVAAADPKSLCLIACKDARSSGPVDPPSSYEHYPTESKIMQKQRAQAAKESGIE